MIRSDDRDCAAIGVNAALIREAEPAGTSASHGRTPKAVVGRSHRSRHASRATVYDDVVPVPLGRPRAPDAAGPSGAAGPHPGDRARAGGGAILRPRSRAGAARRRRADRPRPPAGLSRRSAQAAPARRLRARRRRHHDVAGHDGGGAPRGRRRRAGGRRGDDGRGPQRLRRHAAARPPRRAGDARWASASSTTPRSRPGTRKRRTGRSGWRSSTGTSTTATAPRTSSGADPTVLYASTHEMPLYPGTGARSERGEHGTIVNAPLRGRRRRRGVPRGDARPPCCPGSRISTPTSS